MTSAELAAYQARVQPHAKQASLLPTSDDLESELHEMIEAWARRQDPPVLCGTSRMDRKSTFTTGWPDYTILLPGGKLLLVECKTGPNTLSEEQESFRCSADALNHKLRVVRSYQEFLGIVNETMKI